ncbi:hypothetical protein LJC20_00370 [Eubacteriales bacterium OttesenSCG-928-M02]|nr:hypothetical protein [Eubacteriales bacterium OttesenSCG-928-M02]
MASFNPHEHMMDLKGKEYLQVMWRLVWFREEKPLWGIQTKVELLDTEAEHAVFSATITDENGAVKAMGHGSETRKDFKDYIEKAETKAVGRALAMLGYGTQFAPDLDEGERIADSPVENKQQAQTKPQTKPQAQQAKPYDQQENLMCAECGTNIRKDVHSYSMKNFGMPLCMDCQNKKRASA